MRDRDLRPELDPDHDDDDRGPGCVGGALLLSLVVTLLLLGLGLGWLSDLAANALRGWR